MAIEFHFFSTYFTNQWDFLIMTNLILPLSSFQGIQRAAARVTSLQMHHGFRHPKPKGILCALKRGGVAKTGLNDGSN